MKRNKRTKKLGLITHRILKDRIRKPFQYRCSGYGVYPGGRICIGCGDCEK